jgi:quercetin 2,3-dioxygenase
MVKKQNLPFIFHAILYCFFATRFPVMALKTVKEVLKRPRAHWVGDGFNVFPVFADKAFSSELSPFLMFDYAAPKQFPANNPKKLGVGQHPHRGFETITIAFQGEVEHGDSVGNRGVIGPGDVQWMTAGRGIIHEEFHSKDFAKRGGKLEMCQLWLNLPAKDKMTAPKYQPILESEITVSPLYEIDPANPEACTQSDEVDGFVRIIAGEHKGAKGPATTHTQVDMWDIAINNSTNGKKYEFETKEDNNVIVFVRQGAVEVQGKELGPQDVAIMNRKGSKIIMSAIKDNSKVLLLAGAPINEPIAARGPFVMNTNAELQKAMMDFQTGNFGR